MRGDPLSFERTLEPLRRNLVLQLRHRWPSLPAQGSQEGTFAPDFDVRQTAEALIVDADLPGVDEKDLEISLDFDRLVVHGRRPREPLGEGDILYGEEAPYGSFVRSLTLPKGCLAEDTSADLRDGVLTITVPLAPESRPRKILLGGR